jgi:hypothetical protein
MELPNDCYVCPFAKWTDDGCAGCVADGKIHNASRPIDCPLVEVKEPHGDLIDRDALNIGEYEREDDDTGTLEISLGGLLDLYHKVKGATTIIEAEGGENE